MSLIEFESGKMCGNSERSLQTSDNSLIMVENWVLGALIVTSTIPLEREILACLRILAASGLVSLVRVSENHLIASTRAFMVASFALRRFTCAGMSSARDSRLISFI